MKMKASETLIRAKAVIEDPKNWTQGQYARKSNMDVTSVEDENATCFCSIGALSKIGGLNCDLMMYLIQYANGGIAEYNDTHTHEQVMEVWDKAIAKAIADESNQPLAV